MQLAVQPSSQDHEFALRRAFPQDGTRSSDNSFESYLATTMDPSGADHSSAHAASRPRRIDRPDQAADESRTQEQTASSGPVESPDGSGDAVETDPGNNGSPQAGQSDAANSDSDRNPHAESRVSTAPTPEEAGEAAEDADLVMNEQGTRAAPEGARRSRRPSLRSRVVEQTGERITLEANLSEHTISLDGTQGNTTAEGEAAANNPRPDFRDIDARGPAISAASESDPGDATATEQSRVAGDSSARTRLRRNPQSGEDARGADQGSDTGRGGRVAGGEPLPANGESRERNGESGDDPSDSGPSREGTGPRHSPAERHSDRIVRAEERGTTAKPAQSPSSAHVSALDGANSESVLPSQGGTQSETPRFASAVRNQGGSELGAQAQTLRSALNESLNADIVRSARIVVRGESSGEIRLNIKPEELGQVRIALNMRDGHIAGRIIVENQTVREVFEQNMAALERAFAETGIDAGAIDVTVADAGSDSGDGNGDGRGETRRAADRFDEQVPAFEIYEERHELVDVLA